MDAVARFWSAALDRPIEPGDGASFIYVGAEGDPYRLCIMKTLDPKSTKNRVHLDLQVEDRPSEVKRLVGLGAEICAEYDEGGSQWTTLRDVEGNELCVF